MDMIVGFWLGVLAAFFWSLTNIVDKYLVDKYASTGNVGGILLLSCFFPGVLIPISYIFAPDLSGLEFRDILILIFSGVLMVGFLYFYLKALSTDDASVVMAILVLTPFFSLIFGALILKEFLTSLQIIGGLLVITGSLTVSYQPIEQRFNWRLILFGVLACVITGFTYTLFKFVTLEDEFWRSIFWKSVGMCTTGLILYFVAKPFRDDFHIFIKNHLKAGLGLNTTNETLTLIGDTLFAFAILFAPLALIQTTEAYQPIFVFIIILSLSQIGYTYVTETYTRKRLLLKLIGILFVLIGSYTIQY